MTRRVPSFRRPHGRAALTSVLMSSLVAATCGIVPAVAQERDLDTAVARTASQPALEGPVAGAWRYQVLRRGCPHRYPMLENAQCATASGGPAGGIN